MGLITSCMVGVLFAAGTILALRKPLLDLVFGISLLSTGTILLLIAVGGWEVENRAPLLEKTLTMTSIESTDPEVPPAPTLTRYADPLPQALILTALVIGFGMLTYLIALVSRAPGEGETDLSAEGNPEAGPQ